MFQICWLFFSYSSSLALFFHLSMYWMIHECPGVRESPGTIRFGLDFVFNFMLNLIGIKDKNITGY